MEKKRTSIAGAIFGGLFAVVWIGGWSAGTLVFDAMTFGSAWKQYHTRDWSETTGTVLRSTVKTTSDSDGTSHKLEVSYSYAVDDRPYTGEKDTELPEMISGGSNAMKRARQLKQGLVVPVFYNPNDPSKSVLNRGMTMRDFANLSFVAMFLTPFNLIMLGSWYFVFYWATSWVKRDLPGRVEVFENGTELRIRLPHTTPFAWAALAVLAGSFAGIFVLGGLNALLGMPELNFIGWAAVLAIAAMAYLRRAKHLEEGRFDLIVDGLRRNIVVPPLSAKGTAVQIKTDELQGVTIEREETKDSDGDTKVTFTPTLLYGENQRARLVETTTEDEAQTLAVWLAGKLGTEFRVGKV